MSIDWCVLRASLFPSDFSTQAADEAECRRFHAAVAVASGNPELSHQLRTGDLAGVRALYEARVRSRSVPRGLFAAAGLATREGRDASLGDVEVQRTPSPAIASCPPASDELVRSSRSVIHADAVTLYRRDEPSGGSCAVRLGVPEPVRTVLSTHRTGTRAQWEQRLRVDGFDAERASRLVARLAELGVLEPRGPCSLWNDADGPPRQALTAAVDDVLACEASGQPRANAFATFGRALRLPSALEHAHAVGELLLRCARPEPPAVARILARLLDGRWLPLSELERMAEGLVREATAATPRLELRDEPLARWLVARALQPEIALDDAPVPPLGWSGTMLVGTQWTADGRWVGPTPLAASPRALVSRYAIPGLPERLAALDEHEPVVLAYRGPDVTDEVAAVHVPGALALEHCGSASDPDRTLRLEDLEVCASSTTVWFRVRHDQRPVSIVRAIPYNDAMPGLHPLVRLLSLVERAQRPGRSLLDLVLDRLPVRPRLTFRGHVVARRRAVVPPELKATGLEAWLHTVGLSGPVSVETKHGGLPLSPDPDDPTHRDLFKRLRRGERVAVSERLPVEGLLVDGRPHAVHALVPVTVAAPRAPRPVAPRRVVGPAQASALRGPFRTVRVRALAERMPGVLRCLRDRLDGAPFFYVFLSDALDSELRLRIPRPSAAAHLGLGPDLGEALDELLDRRIVRHWAVEPYLREWDRYGGADEIEAVERFFVADSASLCDGFASLSLVDERRTCLYALTILQTMTAAGLPEADQAALCRRAFEALGDELGLGAGERRALGSRWRAQRDAVVAAATGSGDPVVRDALLRRRRQLDRWLRDHDRARLRTHLRSLLHMTGTRLCVRDNRAEEAWAFFFARKLLDRWRHLPTETEAARPWSSPCAA